LITSCSVSYHVCRQPQARSYFSGFWCAEKLKIYAKAHIEKKKTDSKPVKSLKAAAQTKTPNKNIDMSMRKKHLEAAIAL